MNKRRDVNRRRQFLKDSVGAAIGFGCYGNPIKELVRGLSQKPVKPTLSAVHIMLIVGNHTTFLYNLPLFSFPGYDSPNNCQVILEVSLTVQGRDLQSTLQSERKTRGADKKIYAFRSEEFVLSDLKPRPNKEALKTFKGTIFQGHPEKSGGVVVLTDVTASVNRVIYFQEFSPKTARPRQLEYILFQKGQERFLAHRLTKPPDFDQVLSIKDIGTQLSGEIKKVDVGSYRTIVFSPKSSVSTRLRAGQRIRGQMRPVGAELLRSGEMFVYFSVEKELYFEEGELRTPPEFATTPAERDAGFP